MGLLTLLLSTNSLESITNLKEFSKAVKSINKKQNGFIKEGLEIGFAYRIRPNTNIGELIELAGKYPNIPFSWETDLNVMSMTPNHDAVLKKHIEYAKRLASCYKGPSEIVGKNITLRLVYGDYSLNNTPLTEEVPSLNSISIESLKENIRHLNETCRREGVYSLIENLPKDTPYFIEFREMIKRIVGKGESHVKLMLDVGNLLTSIDGFEGIGKKEFYSYLNTTRNITGGYHLKQVKDGKPLHTIREGGDVDLEYTAEVISWHTTYPIVIEPMPSADYNVDSAIKDAKFLLKRIQPSEEG